MPIEPITAALELATAITNAYAAFLQAATPAQKEKIIDAWLEDREWWRTLTKTLPKG